MSDTKVSNETNWLDAGTDDNCDQALGNASDSDKRGVMPPAWMDDRANVNLTGVDIPQ